ncbi:hypothetical protein yc1106_08686 [Curvularia clavata]|uniref:Heterokaryon incompatibility domain-containing protein n=1 Tax=Curvularia clavata TaxID=95742 RepID=A0A9Q9DW14_CURCL|nr:hypothetical protein yc1106_08686 [Curvularia clavata]
MAQCEFCNAVANEIERAVEDQEKFGWEYDDHEEFVWEYDKVRQNRGCVTCQKVVRAFHMEYLGVPLGDKLGYVSYFIDRWILSLRDRIDGFVGRKPFIGINFAADHGTPNELGFSIWRRRINVAGIKRWIDQCDQNHGGRCHTFTDPIFKIPEATGLIFIDVEKLCLVRQSKDGQKYRYAALSYVWGTTTDPFQTTMSNFDELSKPNAFKLPENIWRLPKTIKDSFLLTRTLGIQYLWVDRFCIIQDDEVSKPHQLASMTSIYTNSYVTIAATEGEDSSYGLCGIGKKRPRTPPFDIFNFTPSCRMISYSPRKSTSRQVYHTRGWTFQEWTFPRRTIVFHDQTVTWACQKCQQQENGKESWQIPQKTYISIWTRRVDPQVYCTKVDEYSRRNLSDPSDVLTAFDAFITVQSRAMKSAVLHGLPELFFNSMLCWHHDLDFPQRRRVDSEGKVLKQFPSWSWAGWVGPTDTLLPYEASSIRMKFAPGRLIYPCIIDIYKLPTNSPPGRRQSVKDLHYYENLGVTTFVKDEDSEEERWVEYKLIVPDDDDASSLLSSTNLLYSTVIEFRTRRLITTLAEYDFNGSRKDLVSIRGSKGQMIGTLDFLLSLHPLDLPKHNVELICISVSEPVCTKHAHTRTPGSQYLVGQNCLEECFEKRDQHLESIYEPASNWQFRCYDVLWIEWEGDIAYRKAIGQVWKEEWDAADTEEVDIRLG